MTSEYIILLVLIFVLIVAAILYGGGLEGMNTVKREPDISGSTPRRRKKRVKFGTKVERRDYDKETGDITDRLMIKINDTST